MSEPECFEVYAIRYGHMEKRTADLNFIGGDPHEMSLSMDYFIWVARGPRTTWVIDTGFGDENAKKRGRDFIQTPVAGLAAIGIDAARVENVIITHLHWDHVGNFDRFPRATFHLQDAEMAYATGRYMGYRHFNRSFEIEEITGMVRQVYAGRVRFHDGDAQLTPGLSVYLIGGHTLGLQSVRVWTKRGWVVVASDAAHYYANMEGPNPFPTVVDIGRMLDGYHRLRELADSEAHIVPGHDPLVMRRYPAVPGLEGKAVRLDETPLD
jgi:glyoxylase-like metal-dependent hydrolase (beta-lactamase superfamily II)